MKQDFLTQINNSKLPLVDIDKFPPESLEQRPHI